VKPDSDAGINKREILASITHPDPQPIPPSASLDSARDKAPGPAAKNPPPTARSVAPPSAWATHRSEICAIVATFVSLIWISAGVAGGSGMPIFVVILFGVAGLAIWLLEVWSGD